MESDGAKLKKEKRNRQSQFKGIYTQCSHTQKFNIYFHWTRWQQIISSILCIYSVFAFF